jgi:anti-sigma factor RsiW
MNTEFELKLQAWLDGELPEVEAREVVRVVGSDPAAAALARELKFTRSWLQGNETYREVPATREFYWSQIERQIARLDRETSPAPTRIAARSLGWWLRWLAPAAIAAVLAVLLLDPKLPATPWSNSMAAEVESPADDLAAITFHSDQGRMNVVWINSN